MVLDIENDNTMSVISVAYLIRNFLGFQIFNICTIVHAHTTFSSISTYHPDC